MNINVLEQVERGKSKMNEKDREIREEAVKRLINRYLDEFGGIVRKLRIEVRKHGGILK